MDFGFFVALLAGPLLTALIAGVAHAAAHDRLRRNGTVGLRLPSLLASDAAWRAGHRAAQSPAYWSLGLLTAADLVAGAMVSQGASAAALTVGLTLLLLCAILWVIVASNRAAQHTPETFS